MLPPPLPPSGSTPKPPPLPVAAAKPRSRGISISRKVAAISIVVLSVLAATAVALRFAPHGEIADAPKELDANGFLDRFDSVVSDAAAPATTEARQNALTEGIRALNDEMQSKTLAFSFPIEDVKSPLSHGRKSKSKGESAGDSGMHTLRLGPPAWAHKGREARAAISLEIPADEALSIVPGDLLILSGVPHVSLPGARAENDSHGSTWILHVRTGKSNATISLRGASHKIEHADKAPKPDAADQST